ncbi:hypothetical protein I3843_14G032300 [Carya illinoinensis]|nr:hypothetical protein I3843_14G032300 [Carya illinoinensis]
MEITKNTTFSATIPELIDKYNYAEWAIRMRTYSKAQDLWKGVIDDNGNPIQQENEHEAINDWRRRNYMALHVIQISCGPDALSKIRTINSSANTARQTLKKKYQLVPAKSIVSKLLGIKQLYDMKKIHKQSEELLSCMCKEISESSQTGQLKNVGVVYDAISRAVKNGISEFVFKIVEMDPSFLGNRYRNSRNILMLAVLYRQSKIFNHIYGLDEKNALTSYGDRNDDNMLHMAGMIEDSTMLNQISGAALQMQRELQWFKQVAGILNPKIIESINRDGLTPQELFAKNHENMIEKEEKWMKDTASSCTVVGALIVTIMFSVAFTVPGGNDQTTGFPIFLKKRLFMFFIIFDALSLSSSSTSVLMFLGILTSRYAEEDFLESLPRKMIIGLLVLFFSIATMMIAFSIALLIMVRDQYSWMVIPIICLACVPVTISISIQSRLLFKMIKSTYFPGIFNRKIELR